MGICTDHGPTARQARGGAVLPVEVEDVVRLAEALVSTSWLALEDVDDRGKVSVALSAMIADLTRGLRG